MIRNVHRNCVTSPVIMSHSYSKAELTKLFVDLIKHHAPLKDLRVVVRAGVLVDQSHRKGLRPLHYAVFEDDVDIATFLIDEVGADINVDDDLGYTPLHVASKNGHYSTVSALLKRGAVANFSGEEGHPASRALSSLTVTPLSLALENNHVACAAALLNAGADPNQTYFLGNEINLIPMEYHKSLEMLLIHGADPNVFSRGGLSPLMKACKDKQLASVLVLLNHGATVNLQCPPKFDQKTALHFAAAAGDARIVRELMSHGATTERPEELDHSALEYGIIADRAEAVNMLLVYGANPNEQNPEQCTPLQLTVSTMGLKNQISMVQSLLKHGANPNHHSTFFSYVGPSLSSLVEYFCYMEEYDINMIKLLLAYGSKVNMTRPTKLLRIKDAFGMLGQLRKLRPYENIFELLVEATHTFDLDSISKESTLSNKQKETLLSYGSEPRDLRHLARLRVRDALTLPIKPKIEGLPLPPFLRGYLLYDM